MVNLIREKAVKGLRTGDSFTYTRTFTKKETIFSKFFGNFMRHIIE